MQDPSPTTHLERLKALLGEALEASPVDRVELIARIRAEDTTLAADLERMLAAHDAADQGSGFLVNPTIDPAAAPRDRRSIGPFKLLQRLGEGGFGEVYLASQDSPLRRQVALKLIKPGMDSHQILARFDAERQALAIMDHPNIARVFDAGTDEHGRPWFAMELVDGEPINVYADKHRLDVRSRIELMIPICSAVHHAHQKGIIHRDLKPGNVLVTHVDGRAVPKVIDFGVAKALGRPLTDKTLFTELRTLVGTPEYMSPEQADLDGGHDIDTRSDVYSLGVLLYELLVGATPFDGRDLRSRAFGEIQRILREVDPPTPSTRLQSLESRASAAASRQSDPGRLSTSLRGELDWVTMKCLEKDRNRRYDSAAALADDLRRFLDEKPVNAGPTSAGYRLRKFARRHRAGVVLAAIGATAITVAATGVVWGYVRARDERDAAIVAREVAIRAQQQAEKAQSAEAEAHAIEQENSQFVREMFESIDPNQARGRPIAVREVLDAAAARVDATPPKNPEVEGALRETIGRAYAALGVLDAAQRQLQRSVELRERSTDTTRTLIAVLIQRGELDTALTRTRAAIAAAQALSGPASRDALLAEMELAKIMVKKDQTRDATDLLTRILDTTRRTTTTQPATMSDVFMDAASTLASIQANAGQFDESLALFKEALQVSRADTGSDAPSTIGLLASISDVYRSTGDFQNAVATSREAYAASERVMGADHPSTWVAANNLALILQTVGEFEESERVYDDLVARRGRILGADHPQSLLARGNRGLLYQSQGRFDLAETEFKDVAARYLRVLGPDHLDSIVAENNYAHLLTKMGRLDEAEPIMRRLLAKVIETQGESSLGAISMTFRLGTILSFKRAFTEAEPLLAKAYASADGMGIADAQAGFAMGYGICLAELGKAAEAVPILERGYAALMRQPRRDAVAINRVIHAMIQAHTQLGHAERAADWQSKLVTTQPTATAPSR